MPIETKVISQDEFDKDVKSHTVKGKWSTIISDVLKDKKPRKVTGLTRGQVAALTRSAKESGLNYVANYKDGFVSLSK